MCWRGFLCGPARALALKWFADRVGSTWAATRREILLHLGIWTFAQSSGRSGSILLGFFPMTREVYDEQFDYEGWKLQVGWQYTIFVKPLPQTCLEGWRSNPPALSAWKLFFDTVQDPSTRLQWCPMKWRQMIVGNWLIQVEPKPFESGMRQIRCSWEFNVFEAGKMETYASHWKVLRWLHSCNLT